MTYVLQQLLWNISGEIDLNCIIYHSRLNTVLSARNKRERYFLFCRQANKHMIMQEIRSRVGYKREKRVLNQGGALEKPGLSLLLVEENSRYLLMPVSFSLTTLSPAALVLPPFFYLNLSVGDYIQFLIFKCYL